MSRKRRILNKHPVLAYNSPTVEEGLNREKIVNAALEILNEEGLKSVTTRRIAERLGVNSGSLRIEPRPV
ncbi:TetR family transcriptional regulator, partial [Alicyclobacillus acidoterrestris]